MGAARAKAPKSVKILVIRRDNIGDLVCTTPLLSALKRADPDGWLGVLVNSYNAPVLDRNSDVDAVVSYRKLKHLEPGQSALAALGRRAVSWWKLRQERLDVVVLAAPGAPARGLRLARWLAPKRIAGFDDGSALAAKLDLRVELKRLDAPHEVERVFALARLFGIEGGPPPLALSPDPLEVEKARARLAVHAGPKVAIHISARRVAQRWPIARLVGLIRRLIAERGAAVLLLWSPGPADHPQHPGDDDKAAQIVRELQSYGPVLAYPTARLAQLIGALAACDTVICSDGGGMHLAAALGKPIVALFGDSPPERWRPWGTRHRVLRAASRDVADLTIDQVLAAYDEVAAPA
jgi:ADP-heptose:LPS heptosyltransferase